MTTSKTIRVGITIYALADDRDGTHMQELALSEFQRYMRHRKGECISYGQHLVKEYWSKFEEYILEDTEHIRKALPQLYSNFLPKCIDKKFKYGISFAAYGEDYDLKFRAGCLPFNSKLDEIVISPQ